MKKYKSDRAFDIVNGLIIAILCVTFILPFWMMIISSFTEEISLRVNGYKLFPSAFSSAGYEYIFSSSDYNILRAIINSVIISVSGTVLSVAVSLITAYALSKKYVVGIKGINVFYIITMFFAGGTIPLYLVIRGIGLYDTMEDLFVNFIGAVVFSALGFIDAKTGGKLKLVSRFVPQVPEKPEKPEEE